MNHKTIDQALQAALFKPDEPAPEESVVFRIKFKKIGSFGDFILFSGRPKSGKTKYLSGFIASAISRQSIFDLTVKLPDNKRHVAHFDTEQSRYSHYKMMQLITTLAEEAGFPDHFKSFRCRGMSGAMILACIEHYLKINPQVGLICLDGLLDTIDSMNDTKSSTHLKNWLKRITEQYNVLLAGVIHRGFSSDKSIGHIGSDGERAAQSVLIVEKNKELKQYILRPEFMRDDDEFEPIAIYYNVDESIWQLTDYIPEDQAMKGKTRKRNAQDYDIIEHEDNVRRIFKLQHTQDYKTIVQNISEQYVIGQDMAKKFLVFLKDNAGLIFKTEHGYTNVRQVPLYATKK